MDSFDLAILRNLQQDGRMSNSALADRVGLSESPCLRRLRKLESDGSIAGYRTELSRSALGFDVTMFVGVSVNRHQEAETTSFEHWVIDQPEILSCHLVSGESDYLLEIVVRSIVEFEAFLRDRLWRFPVVRDIRSRVSLKLVKQNAPLPL